MKKIALLTGGPGYEREVALKSSELFKNNLQYDFDTYVLPEELEQFISNKDSYTHAIPVFHGEYGEDGKIFAFLDVLGIPHTFSHYDVHSLCMNKFLTNSIIKNIGENVGKSCILTEEMIQNRDIDIIKKEVTTIGYPCIIKPNHGGSSFYTYKLQNDSELEMRIEEIHGKTQDAFIVQEFITGDEYSVGVVNGNALEHIMMVNKNPDQVFDYTLKYESDVEIFPEIDDTLKSKLHTSAENIYKFIGCKGCSRIDFIVQNGIPYFLEVNTIPGMTEVSILPKMWKMSGGTIPEFIDTLLEDI